MATQRNIGDLINVECLPSYVTSKMDKEVCEFAWEINNFDKLDGMVVSPSFSSSSMSKVQWQVKILPRDETNAEKVAKVSVLLQLVKTKRLDFDTLSAKVQMGFLDSDRKIIAKVQNSQKFVAGRGYIQSSTPRRELIRGRGYLNGDNRSLTIYFRIDTLGVVHSKQQQYKIPQEIDLSHATRNGLHPANLSFDNSGFRSFLDNEEFADVTISTNTSSYRVSKIIIAAQSPVFKSIFQSNSSDVVQIGDYNDETVKAFLEFLYTGQVEFLEGNGRELLKISDKYQVAQLKMKAEDALLNELNVENASDYLILAHLHSPTSLKPKIISFVNRYKNQIQNTDSFAMMAATHPIIFRDLYMALN